MPESGDTIIILLVYVAPHDSTVRAGGSAAPVQLLLDAAQGAGPDRFGLLYGLLRRLPEGIQVSVSHGAGLRDGAGRASASVIQRP